MTQLELRLIISSRFCNRETHRGEVAFRMIVATFGDLLVSPYLWLVLAISFAGGWYSKRSLSGGFLSALVAPLVLCPIWFLLCLVLAIPLAILNHFVPEFVVTITEFFGSWPEFLQFLLHPASVITFFLFAFFCHSDRETAHLAPVGTGISPPSSSCANPLRKRMSP